MGNAQLRFQPICQFSVLPHRSGIGWSAAIRASETGFVIQPGGPRAAQMDINCLNISCKMVMIGNTLQLPRSIGINYSTGAASGRCFPCRMTSDLFSKGEPVRTDVSSSHSNDFSPINRTDAKPVKDGLQMNGAKTGCVSASGPVRR